MLFRKFAAAFVLAPYWYQANAFSAPQIEFSCTVNENCPDAEPYCAGSVTTARGGSKCKTELWEKAFRTSAKEDCEAACLESEWCTSYYVATEDSVPTDCVGLAKGDPIADWDNCGRRRLSPKRRGLNEVFELTHCTKM